MPEGVAMRLTVLAAPQRLLEFLLLTSFDPALRLLTTASKRETLQPHLEYPC